MWFYKKLKQENHQLRQEIEQLKKQYKEEIEDLTAQLDQTNCLLKETNNTQDLDANIMSNAEGSPHNFPKAQPCLNRF
ncbi:hypothetical protein VSVS12_04249 [Vibrio scophthalmi]|uniref:hypothetical protein n=1 Tax=Vibrio scophthalmi TaxID=45658 RepID=UPI0008093C60|nr:hypothetical protein [Vibrio scophthalmi]ANS87948.1 hypothetical protein VSVS12_04249 [Vibrio scophthalmi]